MVRYCKTQIVATCAQVGKAGDVEGLHVLWWKICHRACIEQGNCIYLIWHFQGHISILQQRRKPQMYLHDPQNLYMQRRTPLDIVPFKWQPEV
jgi:hypothetical protein